MTDKPCAIPNCPATVSGRFTTCAIHRHARLAKDLGISRRGGIGGARCLMCRRIFKDTDWVEKESTFIKGKRGSTFGYRHVACEPSAPRRSKRTRPKPLLEDA